MDKKVFSVVVIPHSGSRRRTLAFSERTLKIAAGAAIGLMIVGIGMTIDYFRIRLSARSYQALVVENEAQKDQIKNYENAVGFFERKINSFREYAAKLNIFAGIKPSDMLKPGFPRLSDIKPPEISEKEMGVGGSANAAEPKMPAGQGYRPDQGSRGTMSDVPALMKTADEIDKNLGAMLTRFEEIQAVFAVRPSISPTDGYRSSNYGWRIDPFTESKSFHSGLDVATAFGNPVVATADGSVIQVGYNSDFGTSVVINHGNGLTTLFGHLSKTFVRVGQKVKRGDKIGEVGHSGRARGDHVHYEIRINGRPIDPNAYILTEY